MAAPPPTVGADQVLDAVQQHARGVRVLEHGHDGARLREHALQLLDLPRVVDPRDETLDQLLERTLRTLVTGRTGRTGLMQAGQRVLTRPATGGT